MRQQNGRLLTKRKRRKKTTRHTPRYVPPGKFGRYIHVSCHVQIHKRGEDGVFGTERFLGYCGGSHHRILLFVITLDSFFIELSEEVT